MIPPVSNMPILLAPVTHIFIDHTPPPLHSTPHHSLLHQDKQFGCTLDQGDRNGEWRGQVSRFHLLILGAVDTMLQS